MNNCIKSNSIEVGKRGPFGNFYEYPGLGAVRFLASIAILPSVVSGLIIRRVHFWIEWQSIVITLYTDPYFSGRLIKPDLR